MGLPPHHRLKHWRQFQTVYERGRRYSGPFLIVRCQHLVCQPSQPTQIGIAVGKRISKKAVVRNRIKRQIRAALRPLLPGVSENYQIVIGTKSTALECEYEHFLRELKQLLTKAEVWNGH